jgi:hypothetical protein
MAQNRIFYAIQALGIEAAANDVGVEGAAAITWMKGVQSVGITTNFNLEQVFELGQLAIFENIENVPEIEVTAEKVIDGNALLYLTACPSGNQNIVAATNNKASIYLAIYPDTQTSASGTNQVGFVWCSGMRPSNVAYTFPVEGNSTESVTFVGNDKLWVPPVGSITNIGGASVAGNANFPDISATASYHGPQGQADNSASGTVFRRQHFVSPTGVASNYLPTYNGSYLPTDITLAVGAGKVQNISVTADIGRENIFELGKYRPYTKYATFPIATTCEIEVVSLSGDRVSASGDGKSLTNQPIQLYFDNGQRTLKIDLGNKNKLTSVNYTGGDTGGGNATTTYSYQGFNYFVVQTGVKS